MQGWMWAPSRVIHKSPDDFKKPVISQVASEDHSLSQVPHGIQKLFPPLHKKTLGKGCKGGGGGCPIFLVEGRSSISCPEADNGKQQGTYLSLTQPSLLRGKPRHTKREGACPRTWIPGTFQTVNPRIWGGERPCGKASDWNRLGRTEKG